MPLGSARGMGKASPVAGSGFLEHAWKLGRGSGGVEILRTHGVFTRMHGEVSSRICTMKYASSIATGKRGISVLILVSSSGNLAHGHEVVLCSGKTSFDIWSLRCENSTFPSGDIELLREEIHSTPPNRLVERDQAAAGPFLIGLSLLLHTLTVAISSQGALRELKSINFEQWSMGRCLDERVMPDS